METDFLSSTTQNNLPANVEKLNANLQSIYDESYTFLSRARNIVERAYNLDDGSDLSPQDLTYLQELAKDTAHLSSIFVYMNEFLYDINYKGVNPINVDLELLDLRVYEIVHSGVFTDFKLQDIFMPVMAEIMLLGNILSDIGKNLNFCRSIYQSIINKSSNGTNLS